jgi:chromosome segregation ATPase
MADLMKQVGNVDQVVNEKNKLADEAGKRLSVMNEQVFQAEAEADKALKKAQSFEKDADQARKEASEVRAEADAYYDDVKEQARQVLVDAEAQAVREYAAKEAALDKQLDDARKEREALQGEIEGMFKSIADLKGEFEALKAKFS